MLVHFKQVCRHNLRVKTSLFLPADLLITFNLYLRISFNNTIVSNTIQLQVVSKLKNYFYLFIKTCVTQKKSDTMGVKKNTVKNWTQMALTAWITPYEAKTYSSLIFSFCSLQFTFHCIKIQPLCLQSFPLFLKSSII